MARDYLAAILEANEEVNLTRITDPEQASVLHLEDSFVALPEMESAPEGPYVDLGTGGGFPGVPLALATGRDCLLVDSVKKKMRVVETQLSALGLDETIKTYGGRIEELAAEQPESFAVATARALSTLPSLLELASPLLMEGGLLVCLKGQPDAEELEAARRVLPMVGMEEVSQRSLALSDDETMRTIITFRKVGRGTVSLPRRIGVAQKRPLSNRK